jgi:2-polyprenyl-3-methyl-5-hydroxy-6-metoxy-1,4-benzoquinol methylase
MAVVEETPRERWWREHYIDTVDLIADFLRSGDVVLEGKRLADIGCGDGIIDLGLAHRLGLDVSGYDITGCDFHHLLREARELSDVRELPANLRFAESEPTRIPAQDDEFDVVLSWSAFEHVLDPIPLLRDIKRILKPDGTFFLQLWPFYASNRGSHLWDWFPEGFTQYLYSDEEVAERLRSSDRHSPEFTEYMLDAYRNTLNRIDLDELQRCLLIAGFTISRVEIYTETTIIPEQLHRLPLSKLMISGVKLLAHHTR